MKKILITVGMVIVSLGIVAGILITVAKREKAPEMETYAYDRLTMAEQESGNGQSQVAGGYVAANASLFERRYAYFHGCDRRFGGRILPFSANGTAGIGKRI